MRMKSPFLVVLAAGLWAAAGASAQQAPPPNTVIPGLKSNFQRQIIIVGDNHIRLIGDVEVEKDDMKISADEMEIESDKDHLTAKGNVTVTTPTERISAESLDFNTRTKLGVFRKASGSASLNDIKKSRSAYGTQEEQVLFYGEKIEKIGYRKYRITKGGFTTCVQATPRWIFTSSTVVININHYALLKNAVMKVKGVPVLYLPIIYYPINHEDRATGFLLPTYGTSSLRGTSISEAFFWAISRSQDATFFVDWFAKTGLGYGAEYRRVGTAGSSLNLKVYRLQEKATAAAAGRKSFQVTGSMIQSLPLNLRARARIDYFSDIQVQQTYNYNVLDASRSQRSYSGGISGNWGPYSLGLSLDHSQYFYNSTQSTVSGTMPRLSFSRKEEPLFGLPLYVGVGGEYAGLIRQTVQTDAGGVATTTDAGISRLDVSPRIRFPFTKWPFLTMNSSVAWHFTRWNESLDAAGARVATPVNRSYVELSANFVGPVLNRIWVTPKSRYAEKIKHTIEPWVNLSYVTAVSNFDRIVKTDGIDYVLGGTTQVQYGLNSRVYAKRRINGVVNPNAVQIFTVSVRQTYYSDSRASVYDPNYLSSGYLGSTKPQKLSPVSLSATLSPTPTISASFQTEYNTYAKAYQSFGGSAHVSISGWLSTSLGWSKRNYIPGGSVTLEGVSQYLNSDTSLRFNNNKLGGLISFNWDLKNNVFLQRRFVAYYNAQCCGLVVEYQMYNFAGLTMAGGGALPIRKDHRFTFGVTLAGIGTFSNIFGALGGGANGIR